MTTTQDALHHPELDTVWAVPGFHAERTPDVPAIVCAGVTLDYAALHRESNRVAHALRADGIGVGDRVAYLGQESVHYYATVFACAKLGAVLVPINFRLTAAEVDHILRDSGSRALVVDADLRGVVDHVAAELPGLLVRGAGPADFAEWTAAQPDSDLVPGTGGDDPVVQLYTSGTTGLPKGVVLAHRSFFAVRDALADAGERWIDWQAGDRSLIGIPGFHVGGVWWSVQGFSAGITNVAMPRFDSAGALRLIAELGVTTACVVPSMLRLLLGEPGADAAAFRSLRKVVYGGSPISEALLQEALPVFDCDFAQIYGLTETGNTAVCLPPADHVPGSPRLRAAGRPYPGLGVKVVDDSGEPLPAGEVGEVCLRTPARMLEYWGLPGATADTLVDGWLHTGDAGYLDDDGYVFISDRIKDMIIVGGENIYPTEIENAIAEHPAVADVAVIGVPDDRFGEAVHAFVALRQGATARARDLLLFCRDRIAAFKIPSKFEFVEQVPRNPSGKVLRRELRDRFWADRDRQVN
ncbi:long-chain-fatty-acid--CoA ligase [Actinokineospora sp. PR83]|uniref:long-chain-fatty-acid--CoA ligase n=1 Tax=Actinokineospora sp. PR83 TaxID=2884908 RepID=UPI001F39FDE5|nr:long-chain-fatty-acid--CoA ligase [Actinokineospora sp. PR83]MCG8914477.1 long-chain-fatty-acid--CoA ligase [Actinokineospora sp. PR83]